MISHNLQHKSLNQIWASCLHIDIWSCKYYFHICSKCICHFHSLYTHSITLECQIVHVIPQEFTLDLTKNYLTYIPCFLVHESQNFQVVSYRLVLLVHHKKGNFHLNLEYYRDMKKRQLSHQFGVVPSYERRLKGLVLLWILSERRAHSFYYANVWKLWTVFFFFL